MQITIKRMSLLNFKGIRNMNVEFGPVTNIYGENATGKTSLFDGFTWLLFGKNSSDDKDFNIKTLDKDNQPIHKLEHEVTATLEVDGREMTFRRMFREKWVKKRGEAEQEFTGHETQFFVDDVPLSQQEYKARVDFVMNESIAKMITSPTYFNQLKWQDRRNVLEAMAGAISNEEIAGGNESFRNLLSLVGNEKFVDFKKRIAARKNLLKQSLETIPTRVDEAERSKPETKNWTEIEKSIEYKKRQIAELDMAIENKGKAYELEYRKVKEVHGQKLELELKLETAKQQTGAIKRKKISEIQAEIATLESQIKSERNTIESNNRTIAANVVRIESLTKRNDAIRLEWAAENSKSLVIDEHALNCPTCKQALPESEQGNIRETLTANFNNSKAANLKKIETEGQTNKKLIDELATDNASLIGMNSAQHVKSIESLEVKIKRLIEDWETVKGWPENESPEVDELNKKIESIVIPSSPVIDNSELKAQRQLLADDINTLGIQLNEKQQIEKADVRIQELIEQENKQAQELADLERQEFTLAEFSKARIETIENRINGKFKVVKFKMFEQQINGGETECCECMVNGVPYSDVNTAGKINAGVDIINALTEHYNINAPVFIDNRESIVNLLDCKSQIINLIVKEGQKQLLVTVQDVLETAAQ